MELLKKDQPIKRRNSLKWVLGFLGGLSILKFGTSSKKVETIKMLSQDGTLVEIPVNKISARKGKADKKKVQTWVWKHNR